MNSIQTPLVSIVTVVYNGKDELPKTIESVLKLQNANLEYIIVDGDSTDGTKDIITYYKNQIREDHISLKVISEPDKGIYDAMNKGIEAATGSWINFLNAGDIYHEDFDLELLFKVREYHKIYFGKSLTVYKDLSRIRYRNFDLHKERWFYNKMPNHQAVFVPASFCKSNKYDLRLKFSADTFFLRKAFGELEYNQSDQFISYFELGGVSNYYGSLKNLRIILQDLKLLESDLRTRRKRYLGHIYKYFLQVLMGKDRYLKFYITKLLKQE